MAATPEPPKTFAEYRKALLQRGWTEEQIAKGWHVYLHESLLGPCPICEAKNSRPMLPTYEWSKIT